MSTQPVVFNRGAVRPLACLSAGWQLVKPHYMLMVGISLVGLLLGSLAPMAVLLGPMMCGLYMCMFALMRGERPSFDLLFKGFDHFLPGLIVTMVRIVPVLVLLIPAYFLFFIVIFAGAALSGGSEKGGAAVGLLFFVGLGVFVLFFLAFSVALAAGFLFAYPLIADRRLSGWEAVKTSLRAAAANAGGTLGLVLLNGALGVLGMLACYVGVFFVLPISLAADAVAYRSVFPETAAAADLTPDASPTARTSG